MNKKIITSSTKCSSCTDNCKEQELTTGNLKWKLHKIQKDWYVEKLINNGTQITCFYHLGLKCGENCSSFKKRGSNPKCQNCIVTQGFNKIAQEIFLGAEARKKHWGQFYIPPALADKVAIAMKVEPGALIFDPWIENGELLSAMKRVYPFLKNEDLYGIGCGAPLSAQTEEIDSDPIEHCIKKFPGGHFQKGLFHLDDWTAEEFWRKNSQEWASPSLSAISPKNELYFHVLPNTKEIVLGWIQGENEPPDDYKRELEEWEAEEERRQAYYESGLPNRDDE